MAQKPPPKIKIDRPPDEVVEELPTQLRKLEALSALYDQGEDHFAMDIATVLRKLFREKGSSKSLLGQLNQWNPKLLDTVATWSGGNPSVEIAPVSGMAFAMAVQDAGRVFEVWRPTYQPPGDPHLTEFSTWWKQTLFHDEHGVAFTREGLVGWACDQDGGAHVDPRLDQEYFRLTREGSYLFRQTIILGDAVTNPNEPIAPERIIEVERAKTGLLLVRAIVRQIAFEVLASVDELIANPSLQGMRDETARP